MKMTNNRHTGRSKLPSKLFLRRVWLRLLGLFMLLPVVAVGADEGLTLPPAAKRDVDFVKDIQPIFRDHCLKCHGPNRQRGDFRLDDKSAAMKGGESFAPAIIPGDGAESPLVRFTAGLLDGMQMPPEGERKLSDEEIGLLRAWIDQGAKWPEESGKKIEVARHWAFEPVTRPAPPQATAATLDWSRTPIDLFIARGLEAVQGENLPGLALRPSREADRLTLIRRATFDLTGLPATPQEVSDFQSDSRPDAFERLADRLLASPHFGERWARHWLDAVKFAESDGFETNQPRPNAWPYRDYVVRAFNEDKPYVQFVFEQLAGDTIGVDEATGFLVTGAWDRVKSPDPVLTAQQRADELHDMVSTTSSTLIGLTVGCARCHNHKFDPITQSDYYAIKAVFAGVQHGERSLRPADFPARQQSIELIRSQLAAIEAESRQFEPLAFVGSGLSGSVTSSPAGATARSTLLIDDLPAQATGGTSLVSQLVPPIGSQEYRAGNGQGELSDPGNLTRFPNLGRSYSYWNNVAHRDLLTWNPGGAGQWQIWLSWGCGWDTHAADARYLIDQDGDLTTRDDQTEIAQIDQRRFSDGTGGTANQPLWSGFYDAGIHQMGPASRLILRGGDGQAYVTADVVCFQRFQPEQLAGESTLPRLRPAVSRQENVERFAPIKIRYLKFEIEATTGGEPCLDELEVFESANSTAAVPKNVALASYGTIATASSTLPGYDIHQLPFVNDGRYGNSASWIANEPGRGWVMLEFPEPVEVDRIVWSRDRPENGHFQDRIPTAYRIEAGLTLQSLRLVASSDDRLPADSRIFSLPTSASLSAGERVALQKLEQQKVTLKQQLQRLSTMPMVYAGRFATPEPTYRLHRGDPMQPKERAVAGGLTAFGSPWNLPDETADAERRVALANWINSPDHPLTSRVMVNRLWQHHFGQGLVATPSDFGRNGGVPSHPELLDWLASEAHRAESPKRLHRLMVTSATYRQTSDARPEGMQADAATRFLWRYPPRRLEAEPLRDAILAVSGNLDDRMYGPGFDLFEPNTNYVKVYQSKRELGPAEGRRMVYQSKPRMQLDEIFGQFDCPDAGQIAPRRTSSITALQALNLLNSRFMLQQSMQFAARLRSEAGQEPGAQVDRAYRLAFQRNPTAEESADAIELIREHGLDILCRALLNSNEFLFVF